jgi:hypothetical protein
MTKQRGFPKPTEPFVSMGLDTSEESWTHPSTRFES